MLILSIIFLISIINFCRKPDPVFVPYEKHKYVVGKLPNGNYEVKPGYLMEHWQLLLKANIYKLKWEQCEEGKTN